MEALNNNTVVMTRRPPRGGRGLKLPTAPPPQHPRQSPPSRGAWIEISHRAFARVTVSSPPSRGAWIEIVMVGVSSVRSSVAPLAGGVD